MLDLKKNPPDVIWSTILSKDQRQKIRAFEKDGFEIHEADTDRDIERFYHYYKKNMVHINGEILPISFFRRLRESSPEDSVRLSVLTKGDVFAGGTELTWRNKGRISVFSRPCSAEPVTPSSLSLGGISGGENGYEPCRSDGRVDKLHVSDSRSDAVYPPPSLRALQRPLALRIKRSAIVTAEIPSTAFLRAPHGFCRERGAALILSSFPSGRRSKRWIESLSLVVMKPPVATPRGISERTVRMDGFTALARELHSIQWKIFWKRSSPWSAVNTIRAIEIVGMSWIGE